MSEQRLAVSMRLPYPPYLRQVIRRSVGIWVLARIMYVVVLLSGVVPPAEVIDQALHPNGAARAVLVVLAAVLVWLDRRRAHELLLPADLGAWPGWFWTASLLTALLVDVAVQTLLAAL